MAVEIVKEYPGLTALEIAREALDFDSDLSGAQKVSKEQSLATTLNRQIQTGLEKRIRRERVKGLYRYFLASAPSTSGSNEDIVVQLSLSSQELRDIDNLVAIGGKFNNRSSAIKWLLMEGIKANRDYLNKVANIKEQIESLKREVQ